MCCASNHSTNAAGATTDAATVALFKIGARAALGHVDLHNATHSAATLLITNAKNIGSVGNMPTTLSVYGASIVSTPPAIVEAQNQIKRNAKRVSRQRHTVRAIPST